MSNIVFLPGLVCDEAVWLHQADTLIKQGHEVQIMDFGTLDSLAEMASFTLQQAAQKFILVGHSMGGRVALEVMRQSHDRVLSLVLMDTGYLPRASGNAGRQEIDSRMNLVALAKEKGMRTMGERWMQGMVLPDHLENKSLCNDILDMIERKSTTQFENQQRALIDRPDATEVLKSLSCHTCIICGDQDVWSPFERHVTMAELVENAELHSITASGHMSTMEQPEQVSEILLSWVKNHGSEDRPLSN